MTDNPGLAAARERRHQAATDEIWAQVEDRASRERCQCGLRRGMNWDDLLPLGAGCTGTAARSGAAGTRGGWVCPALDFYRRLVGGPPTRDELGVAA